MAKITRSRSGDAAAHPTHLLKPAAVAVALCFGTGGALANPTGPMVVNGQVTINQAGNLLQITNSPNSIINWQSFSIGVNEITRIQQQSASSQILNRVVGTAGAINPSVILGALQSNGRVFLINPSGILFGAGAQVDVAGLVASSLNLSNQDFLGGRLRFTDVPGAGSVVNEGAINTTRGGQVFLVAPDVRNSGIIKAPNGEVVLAAGKSVELVDVGTPNLRVEITAPDNEARNIGQIVVDSGRVGIYAGLIEQKGTIRADSAVAGEDGRILLKATKNVTLDANSVTSASGPSGGRIEINAGDTTLVTGTVEAKGTAGPGGTIHVLGDKVGVYGNARVDASGETGGGTVLVGGELQGKPGVTAVEGNPIRNATAVYFGADATIAADAGGSGDGGKIILWSDDTTRSYGAISARGGAASGNGGFVETSGKLGLDVTRGPDLKAPNGQSGTWLLDPNDLVVDFGSTLTNNTGQPQFSTLGESSVVGADLINLQLDGGSNVLLTTTSVGALAGAQPGNITIKAPLIKRVSTTPTLFVGTTSLTVQAANNVVIEPTGSISATSNVSSLGTLVQADPLNVTLQGGLSSGGTTGGVTVGGAIITNGGSVTITGRDQVTVNAPINTAKINNQTGLPGPGGFFGASATGTGATLTIAAPVTSTGASLTADAMNINAPINAGTGGISAQTATSGRPMNLGGEVAGALSLTQAELSNLITTGPSSFSSSGALSVSSPITAGSSSVSMSSSSSFTINSGASLTTAVPLSVSAPTGITVNGPIGAQQVSLSSNSALTINAAVTSASSMSLSTNSSTGALTVNAPVTSASTMSVTTGTAAVNAQMTSATDLNISTSNPVTLGGAGGGLQFDATELGLLVNGAANHLQISGGAMTVAGPISRVGQGALTLSGSSLGQATGATINADNLRLSFTTVNLPEANTIGTIAGNANTFTLTNASLLTIGSVDGATGLSTTAATVKADDLNAASTFFGSTINIAPMTAGRTLNLGGADVAGQLNISAADLANIRGTIVNLGADTANIGGPVSVSPSTFTLVVAPVTAGRPLNIVTTKVGGALEFTPTELSNVTAPFLTLGSSTTGPVAVNVATTLPASIANFTLRSGDTATGITLNTDDTLSLSAQGLAFFADTMNVNASVIASAGNISIAPITAGRPIDLGSKPANTLGLNATELSRFSATGTLTIGDTTSGPLTVSTPVTFSGIGGLNLTTGGLMTINGLPLTTPGPLTLTASDMAVTVAVTATGAGGDINIVPVASGGAVTLGGAGGGLNLSSAELDFMQPGSGVLRIGDLTNTGSLQVTGAISPADATTLSLLSRGSITQSAPITVANLRARSANGAVTLTDNNNSVSTLAGGTGFSSFSFTGAGALAIGTVDGDVGVTGNSATIRSDTLTIPGGISTSSATLIPRVNPLVPGPAPIVLATSLSGVFGITPTDLSNISSFNLTIGDSGSGTVTVAANMSRSSGNISIVSGSNISISDTVTLSAPSGVSLTGSSISVGSTPGGGASVSSSSGNINMTADSMTFNGGAGTVSAGGTIALQQQNALTTIDVGGPDIVSATNILGLNSTDIAALSGGAIQIGNSSTPAIDVTTAISNFGAKPVTLTTKTGGTIDVLSGAGLATTGNLVLNSDTFILSGGPSLSGANVTLNVLDSTRSVDLGTSGTGSFVLTNPALASISTPGTFTLSSGTINAPGPAAFMGSSNVALKFNTSNFAAPVNSNGRLTVAGRNSSTFDLLSMGLTSAAIGNLRPTTVLQIGDTTPILGSTAIATSNLNITQPVAPATGTALALVAGNNITQTTGNTITAPNLRVQTSSALLTENNSVGTLAGSANGTFNFTTTGALAIGPTVDGVSGFTNFGNSTIKSDSLTVGPPATGTTTISAGTLTLAPRVVTNAISVGTQPGGFGLTSAEIDRISASNLIFGTTTQTGTINVTAPVNRTAGSLSLTTAPGGTINVGQALSAQSALLLTGGTVNVTAPVTSQSTAVSGSTINVGAPVTSTAAFSSVSLTGTGANSTVNINAEVSAGNSIFVTADNLQIAGPLDKSGAAIPFVSLQPTTSGRPISIGAETPGAMSLTQSELSLINADSLTIGSSSSGPMTIVAPAAFPTLNTLTLSSGTSITQSASAPILLQKTLPTTGQRVGSLSATASTGTVDLRAPNEIPGFPAQSGGLALSGSAGSGNFFFNNVLPMKLQAINANASLGSQVLINSGLFAPLPLGLPLEGGTDKNLQATLLAALDRIEDTPFGKGLKEEKEQRSQQVCN